MHLYVVFWALSTSKDLFPMQGLMHMPQKMNCHVAMLTRKLLSFYMCTNESNSHNVLSHCLKANISLNHLLYCIICSVAFPKIISPQYEFWSGFIDCFIEQILCNTVYKGPIFPFTSSSTPISPLTDTPQSVTSMQKNNN